ncbi:MAG: hypothetical protein NW701_04930 [Nitrospira sp.]
MLVIRRVMSCLLGIAPLLLIAAGIRIVIMVVQARDPEAYSIHYHYMGDAVLVLSAGCIGLFGCYRLWRPDTRGTWSLVPLAAAFFAVLFPVVQYGREGSPLQRSYRSTALQLGAVAQRLSEAAKEAGQFACTSFSDHADLPSMYVRQDQVLPYVVECVPNADGPATGTAPERPGTIVVATSPDQKQAWFAATVLPHDVGQQAAWLQRAGERLVIAQQLDSKS